MSHYFKRIGAGSWMMYRVRDSVLFAVLVGFALTLRAGDDETDMPKGKSVAPFMQIKLKHTQAILAALLDEDFPEIAKRAQDLRLLSHEEEWQVMETREFHKLSEAFRESSKQLGAAADRTDLDAVVESFGSVTKECARCHKYLRSVRPAKKTPILKSTESDEVSEEKDRDAGSKKK